MDERLVDRMARGWSGGRPYTECGNGTLPEYSLNARRWLPRVAERHGIRTLNDAGAGDMQFIRAVQWTTGVTVRPFDLVARREEVQPIDITRERMPMADAILCRMVLNHLAPDQVAAALWQFWASAPLLIATQYHGAYASVSSDWTRYDLSRWLGEPLEAGVQDGSDDRCYLTLWRLS